MNKIHIKTFDLEGEYIELTSLLKVMNLAQTGGQAGLLVVDGW
jgi:ribosome-associated protein YbcJ (S4-like RNA binding protein)